MWEMTVSMKHKDATKDEDFTVIIRRHHHQNITWILNLIFFNIYLIFT